MAGCDALRSPESRNVTGARRLLICEVRAEVLVPDARKGGAGLGRSM
jgi:hypothetical protein